MLKLAHDTTLSLAGVVAVATQSEKIAICADSRAMLAARRNEITAFVAREAVPAYGFNRGFGHNIDIAVPDAGIIELQRNLIRSHAAGVGAESPIEIVRAMMLLRAQSLLRGNSAVRPQVVDQLVSFLNHEITPVVPLHGSVGASGDLAPLSHLALALIGEGDVWFNGKRISAADALKRSGLEPLALEMKEGLALNNGVQFSTAIAILATSKARDLLYHAAIATALSTQVFLGADTPFASQLHALRPHPGAVKTAAWIWQLMQNSPLRESHRQYETDGDIQDPYSMRCAAQILGACEELITDAERTFEIEINSATDNPLILQAANGSWTNIVSGGHFHGMPIAVRLYGVLQAFGIMARLSNMRCVRYVDQNRNKGLGSDVLWPHLSNLEKSTSSGMMLPEYVSAALTNSIWGALMPNHVFSLSTDAGQEDHVSMSAGLAVKVWDTIPHVARVLAVELAFAAQAAAVRRELDGFPSKTPASEAIEKEIVQARKKIAAHLKSSGKVDFDVRLTSGLTKLINPAQRRLSAVSEEILEKIYAVFPAVKKDRVLGPELEQLSQAILSGCLLEPAIKHKIFCS